MSNNKQSMPRNTDQRGFITMIVVMLGLLIGAIILVYLRVKSAQ